MRAERSDQRRGQATTLDRHLDSEARELTITREFVALPGELDQGDAWLAQSAE
jgi:hypothetical protein